LVLQACEQPIDLPVQEYEGSIVVYSVLETDSVPKVFVTESEPYYTYTNNTNLKYQLIENASIKISDGQQNWELTPDSVVYLPIENNYWYWGPGGTDDNEKAIAFTNSDLVLQPLTTYTVTVEKQNKTATAQTYVLERPNDYTLEYIEEVYEYYGYEYVNKYIEYSFVNVNPGLYYRIIKKDNYTNFVCDYSQYPPELIDSATVQNYQFSYREKSNVLDETVTGLIGAYSNACYSFNQCANTESPDSVEIQFALQVIDSNLVKYINQLEFQEEVSYNPFLEPAPVDHNVEGGIGIVGAISNSPWQTIKIPCE